MKMLQFGQLINRLTIWGMRELEMHEMGELEEMINPPAPVVTAPANDGFVRVSEARINTLLDAMQRNEKISAIKAYRELTGTGLREAKDAVEKYWINNCVVTPASN